MRLVSTTIFFFAALPAFAGDYFDKKYEVQVSPNFGYSNYSGLLIGADTSVLIPLSERWQWKAGGGFVASTRSHYFTYSLAGGALFNFSNDWARAFFVGSGVGYGNRGPAAYRTGDRDEGSFYGYAEFGKRFALNREGTFTWNPNLSLEADRHTATAFVHPINFAWSF